MIKAINKLSNIPILTAEEEMELFIRFYDKNITDEEKIKIKEKIIKHNLRYVLSAIHKYKNRGVDIDDLFQAGCVGLAKSVDLYDVNREGNARFLSLARHYIQNAINDEISASGAVVHSRKIAKKSYASLNERIEDKDGGSKERQDFIASEQSDIDDYIVNDDIKHLRKLIEKLPKRENFIIIQKMKGRTFDDISNELDCTRENVRVIYYKILAKLKSKMI